MYHKMFSDTVILYCHASVCCHVSGLSIAYLNNFYYIRNSVFYGSCSDVSSIKLWDH